MNKKDLINSFESLTPSDYQKERMLNNVLNSGMEKNVHKVSFNFRYAFSTAAAAVCVLAVVVAVGPMYKYHKLSQNPSQKVKTTDTTNDVIEGTETPDIVLPDEAAEDNSTKVATFAAAETDAAIVAEESIEEYKLPNSNGRMLVPEEDAIKAYTPQLNYNKAEAGLFTKSIGGAVEEITLDEYYEFTGIHFESTFDIPVGFSNVTDKFGAADEWTFRYENGSSYIQINTTRNTELVSQLLNSGYITSDINGKTAVVFENGRAYIISDDIAYTIDTYDVSEEDLANLLLSIAG